MSEDLTPEEEATQEDDRYRRLQCLLFLLCESIAPLRLAAIVSRSQSMSWELLLNEMHIAHLDQFVRHLTLEIWGDPTKERETRQNDNLRGMTMRLAETGCKNAGPRRCDRPVCLGFDCPERQL